MTFAPMGTFLPADDLWVRLSRNYTRLEEQKYWPANVYQREGGARRWPGDIEGRTLLSWTLLSRATGRAPRFLEEMLERWPDEVNERGYFGHDYGELISEQQLSGHGWMLRALAELDCDRPDLGSRALAEPIVERLFLPTRDSYAGYPIDPKGREEAGEYAGTHLTQVGRWILSTDVGCFAIGMAGLVDAVGRFGDDRAAHLADEMIDRFLEIDLLAIRAQTHATLSGCRGLLRRADQTGRDDLVTAAAERFDLYRDFGLSETYANLNWFGRPQWTEPCAVVDSIMVAMDLWRRSGDPHYLEFAQLAYFNGLGHGQRANGGFGCDNCPGADGETDLFFKTTESHWCCTMRGSEGLARISEYQVAHDADTIVLPFGLPGRIRTGGMDLVIGSDYPHGARWALENRGSTELRVRLFVPSWIEFGEDRGPRWEEVTIGPGSTTTVAGRLVSTERPLLEATKALWTGDHDEFASDRTDRLVTTMIGPLVYAESEHGSAPICDDYRRNDMSIEHSRKRLLHRG
jgi:uncharacterized protein